MHTEVVLRCESNCPGHSALREAWSLALGSQARSQCDAVSYDKRSFHSCDQTKIELSKITLVGTAFVMAPVLARSAVFDHPWTRFGRAGVSHHGFIDLHNHSLRCYCGCTIRASRRSSYNRRSTKGASGPPDIFFPLHLASFFAFFEK
jgi:hypothetical protein